MTLTDIYSILQNCRISSLTRNIISVVEANIFGSKLIIMDMEGCITFLANEKTLFTIGGILELAMS